MTHTWSSLVKEDAACIGPRGKLLCLWQTPPKIMQYMFDRWADPVLHLLHPHVWDNLSTCKGSLDGLSAWQAGGPVRIKRCSAASPSWQLSNDSIAFNVQKFSSKWIVFSRGRFTKTLRIQKLRICNYGQKLSINFYINWEYSTNYNRLAVNFKQKTL